MITQLYYYKNIVFSTVRFLRHRVYTTFRKLLPSSHESDIIPVTDKLLVRLCPINNYPRTELPSSKACLPGASKFGKILSTWGKHAIQYTKWRMSKYTCCCVSDITRVFFYTPCTITNMLVIIANLFLKNAFRNLNQCLAIFGTF